MAQRRTLETILLANKLVSEEQLKQIVNYSRAVGIDLHEAVLQKKVAPPDAVMMAYAESIGLPFVHFADIAVDGDVVVQIDPMTARQHSFVPISIDHGYVLVAAAKPIIPDVADDLRMIFNLPVRCVLCTPSELGEAITKYYPRGAVKVVRSQPAEASPRPGKKEPKAPAKPKREIRTEPLTDVEMKRRLMMTFASFNLSFAFVYFSLLSVPLPRVFMWITEQNGLLFLLGGIAGSIASAVTWRKMSR